MKRKLLFITLLIISILLIPYYGVKAETYDGEYSIEYLLRHYNVVTLGQNDKVFSREIIGPLGYSHIQIDSSEVRKGDFLNFTNVKGAVLINGDYKSVNDSIFGTQADGINSYVKGTIGNNVSTEAPLATDSNFIDFEKLYNNVLNESRLLAKKAEYHINNNKVELAKPGIYTIDNMATDSNHSYNTIVIKNYNKNKKYIINFYDEYFMSMPNISVSENGSNTLVPLVDYINSGQYTGNIIFNFPNAKFIFIDNKNTVNIIAPDATIIYSCTEFNYDYSGYHYISQYYGNVVANTFINNNYDNSHDSSSNIFDNSVEMTNYNIDDNIIDSVASYCEKPKDYDDDHYTRNYSISDLLQNYNLITLGHKQIDSKSKLLQYGNEPGSVKLFHVTGQVLISGNLYSKKNVNEIDEYYHYSYTYDEISCEKVGRIAFDLESNEVTESYIGGSNLIQSHCTHLNPNTNYIVSNYDASLPISVVQPWDNMEYDNYNYEGRKNMLLTPYNNYSWNYSGVGNIAGYLDNYMNFDRLYNNIVAEQSGIEDGDKVKVSGGVAHIPIGGNYVIDDINDINKIVFDNFEDNKKMITVVTIKNSGDINFPEINRDSGAYKGIVTNDYFGKERATHLYEADTFINEDSYYGNIIFNVPNATYIKLAPNAPFAGHLIAPNADVETPETHFAGCFIVNSIYGEGNTEAHFYPLTAYDNCECSVEDQVPEHLQMRFNELRLSRLLGGEKSTIEKVVIGNQEQYRKDTEQLNNIIDNCPLKRNDSSIVQILTNPKTYSTIGIVIGIIIILLIGLKIYKRNTIKNM